MSTRDPLAPKRIVRVNPYCIDPALDLEQTNLYSYRVTRDESELVALPGRELGWIHIERMKRAVLTALVDSVRGEQARLEIAFRACVKRIEIPGAEAIEPDAKGFVTWATGARVAGDEWIDRIADLEGHGFNVVLEAGQVAMDMAKLAPGARGPFGLPPGAGASR